MEVPEDQPSQNHAGDWFTIGGRCTLYISFQGGCPSLPFVCVHSFTPMFGFLVLKEWQWSSSYAKEKGTWSHKAPATSLSLVLVRMAFRLNT